MDKLLDKLELVQKIYKKDIGLQEILDKIKQMNNEICEPGLRLTEDVNKTLNLINKFKEIRESMKKEVEGCSMNNPSN